MSSLPQRDPVPPSELDIHDTPHDPQPDPEPAAPSLPEPDPGVFHHDPASKTK
jgi:hypothetical protein